MHLPSSIMPWVRRAGHVLGHSPRLVASGLIVAMVICGLLIARNSLAQTEARNRAQSEGDTLLAINTLRITLLDLETGQRGYILTRNPDYLQPYSAARAQVSRQLDAVKLSNMEAVSADEQANLRELGDLLQAKLAELDHTVGLAKAGDFDTAERVVQSNLGKRDMDVMRRKLGVLAQNQAVRRKEGFAAAEAIERNLIPLILLLWLLVALFGWAGLVGERRRAEIQARAERAEELRAAHDRAKLLAEELDHRVKNLFTVVLAIIQLSQNKQAPNHETIANITARIRALMVAHSAAVDSGGVATSLSDIAGRVLAPYDAATGGGFTIAGPEVHLLADQVTPVALILHELATNAAKYGALSQPGGSLELRWTAEPAAAGGQTVALIWRETGGPEVAAAARQPGSGFGTQMTNISAAQLGGTITREWPDEGALVTLTFPQV
jgi:two-component sensor histidine kinase/CHASE3 domain sensor protein